MFQSRRNQNKNNYSFYAFGILNLLGKNQSLKLRKKLKLSSTLNDVNTNQILIYLNDI